MRKIGFAFEKQVQNCTTKAIEKYEIYLHYEIYTCIVPEIVNRFA